jgi:hypothetical protein
MIRDGPRESAVLLSECHGVSFWAAIPNSKLGAVRIRPAVIENAALSGVFGLAVWVP